jgi:F0F1-type ATP synthase membrane subunit b/b'
LEKLLWPAINLIGLLGFIAYKTKAPFFSFVRGRRSEIFEGLNKSKIQVEEAQKRRAEIDSRLSGLELEKSKIASEWKEKSLDDRSEY